MSTLLKDSHETTELAVTLNWQRTEAELLPGNYSGTHNVVYNERCELPVDAAPDWGGDAQSTNPEQALAASLSSCHMLTFLALAAKAKWPVSDYRDYAVAHIGRNARKQMSVTRIDLHPEVSFDSGFAAGAEELEKMHERAHRYCFIANTLADSVEVNIL